MRLVSWGCHISAYTSSRKKKETDRPHATLGSGWHEHTQALTRSRKLLSERVATPGTVGGDPSPISGSLPRGSWAQRRRRTRRAAQRDRSAVAGNCRGSPQFASPLRCASRRWRRRDPGRTARCWGARSGSAPTRQVLLARSSSNASCISPTSNGRVYSCLLTVLSNFTQCAEYFAEGDSDTDATRKTQWTRPSLTKRCDVWRDLAPKGCPGIALRVTL